MTFLSIIAVISLIIFLAIKEILRSEIENKKVKSFLKGVNIAIIPLLLIFIAIVGSKILKIL
jgi:chromate transport protein ChrA